MRTVHIDMIDEKGESIHKATIFDIYEGICEAMRLLLTSGGMCKKMTIEFYDVFSELEAKELVCRTKEKEGSLKS